MGGGADEAGPATHCTFNGAGRGEAGPPLRAVVIAGGALSVTHRELAAPVADEVVVDVAGAGINRADLLQVAGGYPAPPGSPPDIPGLEFAGTVAETGPSVRRLRPGDRVMGILGGGGQAERVLTTEDLCMAVPDNVDLVEAGGIPEVYLTAHDAMVVQAGLRPGERVLVHAAGSGVGTAVVQLAAAMGCEVVGTARTQAKLDAAADLGLTAGILVGSEPDAAAIAGAAGACDVVIDLVGGAYLAADLMVASAQARIVVVGLLAGPVASLNLGLVLQKRLREPAWGLRYPVLRSITARVWVPIWCGRGFRNLLRLAEERARTRDGTASTTGGARRSPNV